MKRYMVEYGPLTNRHTIKLVPVQARDIEQAVHIADHIMRIARRLDPFDFSTKVRVRK